MHRRNTKDAKSSPVYIAGISVFIGILAIVLYLAVLSAAVLFVDIPEKVTRILSFTVLLTGSFAAGRAGGFRKRHKGIMTGAVLGMSVGLVMLLISIAAAGRINVPKAFVKMILCAAAGITGGITGVNKRIIKPPP